LADWWERMMVKMMAGQLAVSTVDRLVELAVM
jgi:hypothetical protein